MDSRTGEVLSLADFPTFDADDPAASPVSDRRARSLNLSYEPGSVEKVLTLSALLDEGKVTPRTPMLVPGELHRQDRVIHDHWEHGLIKLTLAGVLAKSSNVGTVLASDKFAPGRAPLATSTRFGLGQPTNVGLGAESRGILPDPSIWNDQVEDRISFGQSLSVNAVQMAAAVNTIANGGVRVDPTLIQGQAKRDDGMEIGTDVSTTRRVVSETAARQMTLMMERVVDEDDGVAPKANVPGYRVAGKTGTAQRVGTCVGQRPEAELLRRHQHRLLRRLRPGRGPAVHRLRRDPGAEDRRRRRWRHRRPGLLQADGLRPPAVRRRAEPRQAAGLPRRVVGRGTLPRW